ncbi:MAG TPA: dihydrolipoyllysine-residue succinyltransferase, partial [Anaerolineales bacterium]
DLDPSQIPGSGAGGRVLKQDVEKFLAEGGQSSPAQLTGLPTQPQEELQEGTVSQPQSGPKAETSPKPIMQPSSLVTEIPAQLASRDIREERVRLSRRRRTIAQKLVTTQNTAAMLTTFNDVDMSAVMKIRQAHKQLFKEKYGVSLGIVSFFVKAVILGLKDFPRLNAEIQGEEMVIKHYYDIGIAIGAEEGLVVPVLRDADRMTFAEIEKSIQEYVQKTKDHTLSLEDIMGGTFTITNGGIFGSLLSTPILNGPEVGILGLHRIEDRPVAVNGEVVVRPMMYMAVSYDHRIVDGREAVQFLVRVKEAIQNPEILLLDL